MLEFQKNISIDDRINLVKQGIWMAAKNKLTPNSVLQEINNQEKKYLSVPEKQYVLLVEKTAPSYGPMVNIFRRKM